MYFHVKRTIDNLLDITFHGDEISVMGGVSEDKLDEAVFSMNDGELVQVLMPVYEWKRAGRPENMVRRITCH